MSDKEKWYFWYSHQQAVHLSTTRLTDGTKYPKNYALINGNRVVYTTANAKAPIHGSEWDDIQYLGEGEYLYSEGTW